MLGVSWRGAGFSFGQEVGYFYGILKQIPRSCTSNVFEINFAWFQVSTAVWVRSSLFCGVTWPRLVFIYRSRSVVIRRRFGQTYRPHLCVFVCVGKMGPIGCLETSVIYYRSTLRNEDSNINFQICLCVCVCASTFSKRSKEGSRVRQKHNCLGFVFIRAIVTTCFGRAWSSSGHKLTLYTNEEKKNKQVLSTIVLMLDVITS
jgi:hypothetical protein